MKAVINARDAIGAGKGGIGRYSVNLLENLSKLAGSGVEFDVFASAEDVDRDDRVRGLFETRGEMRLHKRVFKTDIKRLFFDHVTVRKETERMDADILHALKFVLPAVRRTEKKARWVVTIHDLIFLERPELFPVRTRTYWKSAVGKSASGADLIVAPSVHTREQIASHFGADADEKCEVIPHGVDPIFSDQGPYCAGGSVKRKNMNGASVTEHSRKPYFLCVGTLEPRKNCLNVLKAFGEFLSRGGGRQIKLIWAGSKGWKTGDSFRYIGEKGLQGKVELRGFVSDDELKYLYDNAVALIYPSLDEGFGLPVLEAMACGCPVIHSGRGAIGEVAGKGQISVDPMDPCSIGEGMELLWRSEKRREAVSADARERAKQFSWERSAETHLRLYDEIL